MELDRLNSPTTSTISLEVLGHQLLFSQDPNSGHLGTTVWDASTVFVKFLEKNCRKGRFCPSKLKGKRVIELGAGCGVAGFGMALLGCNVVSTDQIEVLPLLKRNVERNTSRIMQMNPGLGALLNILVIFSHAYHFKVKGKQRPCIREVNNTCVQDSHNGQGHGQPKYSIGSIEAAELDWGNEDHIRAVGPPFDYIIGTDVVYAEHLLERLLRTIFALSGPKTSILVGYEIRSTSVHEQMLQMWKRHFDLKIVPRAKMDDKYQHPSIQLYIMGQRPQDESKQDAAFEPRQHINEVDKIETTQEQDESGGSCNEVDKMDDYGAEEVKDTEDLETKFPRGNLSDWEGRRYGSMAARLLQNVKIT